MADELNVVGSYVGSRHCEPWATTINAGIEQSCVITLDVGSRVFFAGRGKA